jgi:protein-L-isoaspartate(D-aspartate) O-methyltransferase
MMIKNSWVMGAIAVVLVGGAAGYYIVQKSRKPASLVTELSDSRKKNLKDMVEQLLKLGIIKNKRVADTMMRIDRANYVPSTCEYPYMERAVPIGFNATISAPHMHALGLDILSPKLLPGATVLDVGCGSGYISACLAYLVGPDGKVFGIDHVPELVEQAKANIFSDRPLLLNLIDLTVADGFQGLPAHAPFDAIYVGAACPAIPEALVEQLKPEGMLVIPVGPPDGFHRLVVLKKGKDGSVTTTDMGPVRFVPLTTFEKQIEDGAVGMTKVVKGANGEDILMRPQYYPAPDTTPAEIKILKMQLSRHNS